MSKSEYRYTNKKDGRVRVVFKREDGTITSKSYPRVVMEKHLGRDLLPNEDVHHKDGDVTNNNIDNLEIILHGEHQRQHVQKYFDKLAVCDVCGKEFVWTGVRQRRYYIDLKRGLDRIITCSLKCSSYYGRMKQLGRLDICKTKKI